MSAYDVSNRNERKVEIFWTRRSITGAQDIGTNNKISFKIDNRMGSKQPWPPFGRICVAR